MEKVFFKAGEGNSPYDSLFKLGLRSMPMRIAILFYGIGALLIFMAIITPTHRFALLSLGILSIISGMIMLVFVFMVIIAIAVFSPRRRYHRHYGGGFGGGGGGGFGGGFSGGGGASGSW